MLLGQAAQPFTQIRGCGARTCDLKLTPLYWDRDAAGDFHRREQLGCFCGLQSFDLDQRERWSFDHRAQGAKSLQELASEFDSACAFETDADEYCDEFS